MGKVKYSRKNLVGKKKNNTMKKKYPKKQKGKKLKNNKKIKMKMKANKIKRKYSLKVKKQKGGADYSPPVPSAPSAPSAPDASPAAGISCSNCLKGMDTNAIIVSKPNKDGNCPKGFKKEGDFCVSTNIKDSKTTKPDAPVETNIIEQNVNSDNKKSHSVPISNVESVPIANVHPAPIGTSEIKGSVNSLIYPVPEPSPINNNKKKENNSSQSVNAKNGQDIEVKETTDETKQVNAKKNRKSRTPLLKRIQNGRNSGVSKINKTKDDVTRRVRDGARRFRVGAMNATRRVRDGAMNATRRFTGKRINL